MKIDDVIWLRDIVDKLAWKHGVDQEEVEKVLDNQPKIRFAKKGERKGEDVYMALGQTYAGRYLAVFFVYKKTKEALILSARDMVDRNENNMAKSKTKTLPEFDSTTELVDFFDSHDMSDYWEQMPEADFEIKIKRRKHLIALKEDVVMKVTRIAKAKKVLSEALINTWLREKLQQAS